MSDVLSANSRHLLLLDCQHCPLNPGSSLGPPPFTEAWRPSQGPNMRQFHGSSMDHYVHWPPTLRDHCASLPSVQCFGNLCSIHLALFFGFRPEGISSPSYYNLHEKFNSLLIFLIGNLSLLDMWEKEKKVPHRKTNLNNVIFGESKGNRKPQGVGENMRREQVRSASTFTKHKGFSFETISLHSMHSLTWSQNMCYKADLP